MKVGKQGKARRGMNKLGQGVLKSPRPGRAPWAPSEDLLGRLSPELRFIGRHIAAPGWRRLNKPLKRDFFDLWWVRTGSGSIKIDGTWHCFKAGDWVTVKPGERLEGESSSVEDPFEVFYLFVDPFASPRSSHGRRLARTIPTVTPGIRDPDLDRIVFRMFELWVGNNLGSCLEVKALCLQLFAKLFQSIADPLPVKARHSGIETALEYIKTNFHRPLSVRSLAGLAGLSPGHFSHLFSRRAGVSPVEHVVRLRMSEARLLLASGVPVKQAAYESGFRSPSFFTRCFRKRFGMSPREFARTHSPHASFTRGG